MESELFGVLSALCDRVFPFSQSPQVVENETIEDVNPTINFFRSDTAPERDLSGAITHAVYQFTVEGYCKDWDILNGLKNTIVAALDNLSTTDFLYYVSNDQWQSDVSYHFSLTVDCITNSIS